MGQQKYSTARWFRRQVLKILEQDMGVKGR